MYFIFMQKNTARTDGINGTIRFKDRHGFFQTDDTDRCFYAGCRFHQVRSMLTTHADDLFLVIWYRNKGII